ncbi:DUF2867 domain-containing protein [Streptomyces qinglanensis]|uniref:DUF2867 domain-containing protein n=1 Tax=Streptomyces qinglanensis TaxID=943816 RepID=A0A1H9PL77_9ACTN|nr:DUF2867 domain-containing protein [Streptomyces qinglanensis]SER49066.1 Protein of unknown function [Streptomyces qinglanensis]
MRLPRTAHTSRPWRIHQLAPDFRVEDVWRMPTPGGPDDLVHLVDQMANGSDAHHSGTLSRLLFAIRWRLGRLLGWDKADAGVGTRVPTLRDRLPADLRNEPPGPDVKGVPVPFTSVYRTHDEWAAEMANLTVHAVMHIGWVADPKAPGGYRGQMAVLVKPNGFAGSLYMAAIKPFRYLGVYQQLLLAIGREWRADAPGRSTAHR